MKRLAVLMLPALALVSCRDDSKEVEVDTTRPLITEDESLRLNATNTERFLPPEMRGNPGQMPAMADLAADSSGTWTYDLPEGWNDAGPRTMREVNLAFGDGGEVYVSLSGGSVQENVDRWYRQFGAEPKPVESLERIPMLGGEAVVVEAEGHFEPGMGRPGKDNQGLVGAMALIDGRIVTVKMTGDSDAVKEQREKFLAFVGSLKRGE